MKRLMKGFTMIELLIVIAVLGVLAVAVLSAINPIEQINRGRDTGSRSDSEQLLGAIDRYYTTKTYYPWVADANSLNIAVDPMVELDSATVTVGGDAEEMLTNLSSGGTAEIKASFVSRITAPNARTLSLYNTGVDGDSTYVCFLPRSNSFRSEALGRCQETTDYGDLPSDYPPTACPDDGTCLQATESNKATGCYACLP